MQVDTSLLYPIPCRPNISLLPARADGPHSWTVTRQEIEARNYDLKAVNPNARNNEDTRTPEELLDLIEVKGREVAEALAALRRSTHSGS